MFNFALKKTTNKPAQESLAESKPEIRSYEALNLSEGGRHVVITGTIRGIVSALAKLLRLRGDKPEAIADKIRPFVASCVTAGDLGKREAEYILSDDWYFTQSDYIPCYCRPSDSMYSLFWDIVEEAKGSKMWNSDIKNDLNKNLNPEEKSILDAFEKARKEYYDAMRIRDEYFSKRGSLIVHDVLRKYAQHISAIDEEFYKFMTDSIAETLSQMDDDQSCPSDPSVKTELLTSRTGLTLEESDS